MAPLLASAVLCLQGGTWNISVFVTHKRGLRDAGQDPPLLNVLLNVYVDLLGSLLTIAISAFHIRHL